MILLFSELGMSIHDLTGISLYVFVNVQWLKFFFPDACDYGLSCAGYLAFLQLITYSEATLLKTPCVSVFSFVFVR